MCSRAKKCQNINLRLNLEVKEYCKGQNLVKYYNASLWKRNKAPVPHYEKSPFQIN